MPYRLVKGEFHLFYKKQKLVGSQPDGDSIWFKPDNRALLSKLGSNRRNAAFNAGGLVQLRLEAIDALELYFRGSHQFLEGATKARNFLLNTIGFRNVEFSGGEGLSVKVADPHPIAGYILTKAIDPDGKPVSFVYAEKTKKEDGSEPFLNIARMSRSANAKLTEAGWAYPAFYEGLPADLRNQFAALAHAAWGNKRGLWAKDKSLTGVNAPNLVSLETIAIWPKLFRRLLAYFKQGNAGLAEFDGWLRAAASRDDKLWIISEASAAYLHNIVKISRNKISLIYSPEDLVIVPR